MMNAVEVREARDAGHTTGENVGHRIILPSSYTGGPRYMHQLYLDAMAIVEGLYAPTYFITFTCNPKWPEIVAELFPGQQASDRPDLATRVFHLKLNELLNDLKKEKIFGEVLGLVHVIEFQKRGLPHAHILVIVHPDHRPKTAADLDKYISAEIPDPTTHPLAYEAVRNAMMHGPCGDLNKTSPCMEDGHCTKHYPKDFVEHSSFGANGFPEYRRRKDGRSIATEKYGDLDNRWVVPHNLFLAAKYGAHINIECCTSTAAILYLFKYIYKGSTRATIVVGEANPEAPQVKSEIHDFVDGRYIAPCEAIWRIYGFGMQSHFPTVIRLQLHLPGGFLHVFRDNEPIEDILARAEEESSTLTQFFKYNTEYPNDTPCTYVMFPRTHVFCKKTKKWIPRSRGSAIGRLYFIQPSVGELFYLRLLLSIVESPKSFPDLRSFEGILHNTFKDACRARGLLQNDSEWMECLESAAKIYSGLQLRKLFVQILVYCSPCNPDELWLQFQDSLSFDFKPSHRSAKDEIQVKLFAEERCKMALADIQRMLEFHGKTLADYHIPLPFPIADNVPLPAKMNCLIAKELSFSRLSSIEISKLVHQLNPDQRRAYDAIMNAYHSKSSKAYFIDGPAGTGKTFLYSTILSTVRAEGKIAIAVAGSGIAALLLEGGRTAHSRFNIPIPILDEQTCNLTKDVAELLKQARIIIWDEAPMTNRRVFECVDRTLKDLMKSVDPLNAKKIFGGKVVVFGGDFRQIPPVVKRGSREDTISASLKRSKLWNDIEKISLTINMRLLNNVKVNDLQEQTDYANWLLSIGQGSIAGVSEDYGIHNKICLPMEMLMDPSAKIEHLIVIIYPQLQQQLQAAIDNPECMPQLAKFLAGRMIMTPKNDDVDNINMVITDSIPGICWTFDSADNIVSDGGTKLDESIVDIITPEFLHTLDAPSLPPHRLKLKVGCPVIMLRNLAPSDGLCNGTRLTITHLSRFCMTGIIMNGPFAGNIHHIPRMENFSKDLDVPFKLCRLQFPVRPAFALTINKAQGQTLQSAGLYLRTPVFTHGQLYVALSRTTSKKSIHILTDFDDDIPYGYTINVVYPELLR
jgi:hypothetical protein